MFFLFTFLWHNISMNKIDKIECRGGHSFSILFKKIKKGIVPRRKQHEKNRESEKNTLPRFRNVQK